MVPLLVATFVNFPTFEKSRRVQLLTVLLLLLIPPYVREGKGECTSFGNESPKQNKKNRISKTSSLRGEEGERVGTVRYESHNKTNQDNNKQRTENKISPKHAKTN